MPHLIPDFGDLTLVRDDANGVLPARDRSEGSYTLANLCERAYGLQKPFQGEWGMDSFRDNVSMSDCAVKLLLE